MKKIFASLLLIAAISSCKKGETPAKTYNVEYKLELTSIANTTLSGTATYVSKASATSSAVLASPGWTFTENNWALKKGDQIGFTATVANVQSFKASIVVDGGVKVFQAGGGTSPTNTTLNFFYTIQ